LYQTIGNPQRLPNQRFDNLPIGLEAPQYCVPPAIIGTSAEELVDADIVITDFGESFVCESNTRTDVKLLTPVLLLPPESIFKDGLSRAVDIWTAGCTIYDSRIAIPLRSIRGYMNKDHVVAEMISTLGPLPERWWKRWKARKEYFLDDGSLQDFTTQPGYPVQTMT
jgi:serine/threonine-protein kinase SRPK3